MMRKNLYLVSRSRMLATMPASQVLRQIGTGSEQISGQTRRTAIIAANLQTQNGGPVKFN